jgi:hypothetical protein
MGVLPGVRFGNTEKSNHVYPDNRQGSATPDYMLN